MEKTECSGRPSRLSLIGGLVALSVSLQARADDSLADAPGASALTTENACGHYVVSSGDTIGSIAQKLETTVDEVLAANPQIKDKNHIERGQRLRRPCRNRRSRATTQPEDLTIAACSATKLGHQLKRWTPTDSLVTKLLEESIGTDPAQKWVFSGYELCAQKRGSLLVSVNLEKKEGGTWWVQIDTGKWSGRAWLRVIETPGASYSVHVFEVVDSKWSFYFENAPYNDEACGSLTPSVEYWRAHGQSTSSTMRGEWAHLPHSVRDFMCNGTSPDGKVP